MSQHYSDPARAKDPHALPDIEVFYVSQENIEDLLAGWYWWPCFPGCLPDGDANGPFASEAEAIEAATGNFTNGDGPWETDKESSHD